MNYFSKIQVLGKALMLPIAVLPIAGILLRIGQSDVLNQAFITAAGAAIFDHLALLFAIGVAVGLAKDNAGAAGLAGAVGYFVIEAGAHSINADLKFGVLSGIIGGIIAGVMYNKYHKIQLPEFLGFFGGRRFVPIVTSLVSLVVAGLFGVIWPAVQKVLDTTGNWMTTSGEIGTFLFGFLNRLLIPTGLHHILNNITWFVFGTYNGKTGDLNRFFAGDPNAGIFMTGFFPIMMFGLPAAAFAIYTAARKERKAEVAGMLISVSLTAFLTGITEPIEFLFMFLAPLLYLIHALLTGLALAVTTALGVHHGFTFSAGLFDFVLNWKYATKPEMLLLIGPAFAAVYYFVFLFFINKFDIETPGREKEELSENISEAASELAPKILKALGGKNNLTSIDSCITRLRIEVKDKTLVDEEMLKFLGAKGVLKPGPTSIQVIFGAKAEIIAQEIRDLK